jgi:hypothetical protein
MKVFELKKAEAKGKWKMSRDKEFHNVCFVFKNINLIKISSEIGHIFRMRRTVKPPERKRLPARSRHKQKNNIKIGIKKVSL